MSFNLSSMERGELGQSRCTILPLAECMQDIGTAKPNARGAIAQALGLCPGFSDFGRLAWGIPRSVVDAWTEGFCGVKRTSNTSHRWCIFEKE